MLPEGDQKVLLAKAQELRERGESARRRDGATARRCYEEAVALLRQLEEPLFLAHTVRHLGDIYFEEALPELAEPCYQEALELYRKHPERSALDLANAIRSLAVLRAHQGRALWEEAREIYTTLGIEAGVKEAADRIAALSAE